MESPAQQRCICCDSPDVDGGRVVAGEGVVCITCNNLEERDQPPRKPHQVPPGELYAHTRARDLIED